MKYAHNASSFDLLGTMSPNHCYYFVMQSPAVFPTGWAGEVGDGPTTAYDALEPKKWKPADKE